nr:MAG TPA: hypothetical protein [Caudoviricetes sp.]
MKMIKYVLATLLLLVVWSCRTTEYVPVEVVRSDTTYINKVQRDSIYQLDSVYILDRGDTVLITKTKYLYRDKLVRDTVYTSKTDSIQVPYPVERKQTKWEQLRLNVGGWAIGIIITSTLIFVGWIVFRLGRK